MYFKATLQKIDSGIYQWYFAVPLDIASNFIDGKNRRVLCTVNNEEKYHCAIHGDGNGGYRILLNKQRCKRLELVSGEEFSVNLEKDTSEFGTEMSEELREVLDQNPAANGLFNSLSKGVQRTLIYWSDNVKSSEIKIRRALVMTEHLVQENGKADFKLLNVAIKKANQAAKRG